MSNKNKNYKLENWEYKEEDKNEIEFVHTTHILHIMKMKNCNHE